jgi:CubicO group peptidase (beta-lactamase class C family)
VQDEISSLISRRSLLRGSAILGAGAALGGLPFGRNLAFAAEISGIEAQWPNVTAFLDKYVGEKKVPGMVAALGWGKAAPGYILRGTEGFDDPDADGANSLFRTYSMTKPVTGMAAMMLIDQGKLGLDQKLADFIPEFAQMNVALDPGKSLDARPAKTQITIRHLLTHTAGFGYAGVNQDMVSKELRRLGVSPASVTRLVLPGITDGQPTPAAEEFIRRAASVPLLAEPGTAWHYSMSLDILGIVIARIAGTATLAEFLTEHMFGPAVMTSSYFQVPGSEVGRLTTNYGILGAATIPIDPAANSVYLDKPAFAFGGAGLVTTPADYDRFLSMIANGGVVGGNRVMSKAAVRLGTSDLLPKGTDIKGTYIDGAKFGAGGRVGVGPTAGTFGWSGAAGTVGFANTRTGLRAGLFVQYTPSGALPIQRDFPGAVLADLATKRKRG